MNYLKNMSKNDMIFPYGYIYEIINNINGKTYIGQRKLILDKSWRQYMGSGKLIKKAIIKYGEECFTKKFICYAYSRTELNTKEKELLQFTKNDELRGSYNNFIGSPGGEFDYSTLSTETKQEWFERISNGLALSKKNKLAKERRIEAKYIKENFEKEFYSIQVIDLYKYGFPKKEISQMLKLSRDIVQIILKENNVNNSKTRNFSSKTFTKKREKVFENKCNQCNKIFQTKKKTKRKYCSNQCKSDYQLDNSNFSQEKIIDLYVNKKLSTSEISKIINLSQPGVVKRLHKANVKMRGHGFISETEKKARNKEKKVDK